MTVWRVTRRLYAADPLNGEGAARAGNRWNSRGVRLAYTSTGRALAVLEMLIHISRDRIPADTVLIPIEIADSSIQEPQELPEGWSDWPYRETSRALGDRWVRSMSSLALLVPSAVLRPERNLLINPGHPDFPQVRVHPPEENALDPRVFGGRGSVS